MLLFGTAALLGVPATAVTLGGAIAAGIAVAFAVVFPPIILAAIALAVATGLVLGLAGVAIGLGLGAWKLIRWARKKYKTAKLLREAKLKREGVQTTAELPWRRRNRRLKNIWSVFTRGRSKLGKELMVEQRRSGMSNLKMIQSNPVMKRRLMAKQLLLNMHRGGAVQLEARLLFEALKLPRRAREMIENDKKAFENDDFVNHVMQKMRGI